MQKAALILVTGTVFLSESSYANALGVGPGGALASAKHRDVVPTQYYGPGSGTGMGRYSRPENYGPGSGTGMGRYFGPGSGTGMGRCRPVHVEVCRGGFGDGRGPRCWIEQQVRCR